MNTIMKRKTNIKQLLSVLIVVVLLLNIETVELALFINAIGVDVFILLIEAQLAALLMGGYRYTIKPVVGFFLGFSAHPFILPNWPAIKNYPGAIAFVFPPGAVIMFLLVCGAITWGICELAAIDAL